MYKYILCMYVWKKESFSGSSAGKESTCNAEDPASIPGSGRSPAEGISYPLQYSWASLVAQTVKNLPAMRETWVQSLDWEDPLEEGMATHPSILAWRIPMDRGALGLRYLWTHCQRRAFLLLLRTTNSDLNNKSVSHIQESLLPLSVNLHIGFSITNIAHLAHNKHTTVSLTRALSSWS